MRMKSPGQNAKKRMKKITGILSHQWSLINITAA